MIKVYMYYCINLCTLWYSIKIIFIFKAQKKRNDTRENNLVQKKVYCIHIKRKYINVFIK